VHPGGLHVRRTGVAVVHIGPQGWCAPASPTEMISLVRVPGFLT
jgi:hypothetical protein